jgi:hypothetical protein
MGEYFDQVIRPEHGIEIYSRINDKNLDSVFKYNWVGFGDQFKLDSKNEDDRFVYFKG